MRGDRVLVNVHHLDDQILTCAQEGAYTRLLLHWVAHRALPDDDVRLAVIARLSTTLWKRHYAPVLRPLFSADSSGLTPIHDVIRLSDRGFGPTTTESRTYGCNWVALRSKVLERDGFTCMYCCATNVPLACDHVIPYSRGGPTTEDNLVAACVPCNTAKSNKTPEEWRGW